MTNPAVAATGEGAGEQVEPAAEGRSRQGGGSAARLVLAERRGQLMVRHDRPDEQHPGRRAEGRTGAEDDRGHDQQAVVRPARRQTDDDDRQGERADRFGDQQDPAPVPPVDDRAGRESDPEGGADLREPEEAGERGRSGQRHDQQGVRDLHRFEAEVGGGRADPENLEASVAAQGYGWGGSFAITLT